MSAAEGRSAGSTDQQKDMRSRKWVGSDRSCNITRVFMMVSHDKGLCKVFFSKNPSLLRKWVGGSRSHSEFFSGKSSQNSPKPVLIFWSSIPCVLCLYIHC